MEKGIWFEGMAGAEKWRPRSWVSKLEQGMDWGWGASMLTLARGDNKLVSREKVGKPDI